MNRSDKEAWIASLRTDLDASSSVIVADYCGLTVAEMQELRSKAREMGAQVKITKNRLTRLALKGSEFEGLSDVFVGTTLTCYSDDIINPAKVVAEFAKINNKLKILGGAMNSDILDVDGVKKVAAMLNLEQSRAKLAGLIQAPAGKIARVFKAYAEKDQVAA